MKTQLQKLSREQEAEMPDELKLVRRFYFERKEVGIHGSNRNDRFSQKAQVR